MIRNEKQLTSGRMANDLSGWNGRCKPDKSRKSFPQPESTPMNGLTTASWRTEENRAKVQRWEPHQKPKDYFWKHCNCNIAFENDDEHCVTWSIFISKVGGCLSDAWASTPATLFACEHRTNTIVGHLLVSKLDTLGYLNHTAPSLTPTGTDLVNDVFDRYTR